MFFSRSSRTISKISFRRTASRCSRAIRLRSADLLLKVLSISRLVLGAVWFTIGDSRGPAAPDEQLSGESLQFALNEVTLPGRNTLALQTCNDRVEDMPYSNDVLPSSRTCLFASQSSAS